MRRAVFKLPPVWFVPGYYSYAVQFYFKNGGKNCIKVLFCAIFEGKIIEKLHVPVKKPVTVCPFSSKNE